MKFYAFQIVIEKEPEDDGYFAYSPTVPGCVSNGSTIEATRQNMQKAIELHVAQLRERGQRVPQGNRLIQVEEFSVALPE